MQVMVEVFGSMSWNLWFIELQMGICDCSFIVSSLW